jgi:hypothetical protein
MAIDGWHIISQYPEARECSRELLRWLAQSLAASAAEIQYNDEKTSYRWQERVDRVTAVKGPKDQSPEWDHPFPSGLSKWRLEGFSGDRNEIGKLLDLLAEQWLHTGKPASMEIKNRRLIGRITAGNQVCPAWAAVSRSSRLVLSRLYQLGHSQRPLLIIGENGSGRTYFATLIHQNGTNPSSPFSDFGITGSTGTMFVADWQNLNEMQQDEAIDDERRLIASAEPGDGFEMLQKKWNLKTGGRGSILVIPPLRKRKEDIPILAGRFLEQLTDETGYPVPDLSTTAVEALSNYCWPGNVRELKVAMSWALEKGVTARIGVGELPPAIRGSLQKSPESSFPARLAALEYEALKEELSRQRGNMTKTARALGLTPRQVSWRVRKYGIEPQDFKPDRIKQR